MKTKENSVNMNTTKLLPAYNGKVLFQNKRFSIEVCTVPKTGRKTLVVIREGFYTDFVMRYEDKTVAFDRPEQLPDYILKKVGEFSQDDSVFL